MCVRSPNALPFKRTRYDCETPIGRTGAKTLPHHRRTSKELFAISNILASQRDILCEMIGISTD
jgi:hypothetical protein